MLQLAGVVEGIRQGCIDAAQYESAQGHAQNQPVTEPAVALPLHGEHIAGVKLRQHADHHAESDQVKQIDRQETHQR